MKLLYCLEVFLRGAWEHGCHASTICLHSFPVTPHTFGSLSVNHTLRLSKVKLLFMQWFPGPLYLSHMLTLWARVQWALVGATSAVGWAIPVVRQDHLILLLPPEYISSSKYKIARSFLRPRQSQVRSLTPRLNQHSSDGKIPLQSSNECYKLTFTTRHKVFLELADKLLIFWSPVWAMRQILVGFQLPLASFLLHLVWPVLA